MLHGLIWLPLLGLFMGLAWAGWNEFQKLEAYKAWAAGFERSKYDIYAVIGLRQGQLSIGRPTRQGPIELTEVSLASIQKLTLTVNGKPVSAEQLSQQQKAILTLWCEGQSTPVEIPFADGLMAGQWQGFLAEQAHLPQIAE